MNKRTLCIGGILLYLSLFIFACSENIQTASFDVLVSVDKSFDNAPATLSFSAQNNGPLQGEFSHAWSFGDGEVSTEVSPSHVYNQPGEYEVKLVLLEAAGARGEGIITVNILPPTNLAVSDLSFTPMVTLSQGQEGNASWLYKQSTATANPWRFGLYLIASDQGAMPSFEATAEGLEAASDRLTLVSTVNAPVVEVDGDDLGSREDSVELSFIVPPDIASGDYYLAVIADDQAQVGEVDREDNIALSVVPVSIRGLNDTGADFSLCGLSVSSFIGVEAGQRPLIPLGEQLSAQLCIANLGDSPVIESPYAIYLSQDGILDDSDILLAQGVEQAIGAEDRLNLEIIIDIPSDTALGVYRLLGVADPEGTELERREDNNLRASPIPFELVEPGEVAGVDLVVSSIEIDREQIYWGQKLSGTLTLNHRGDVDVSRLFVVRFNALPVDMGIPPQQLPSLNVNGIEAGQSLSLPFELSISPRIPEGRYRLQIELDPTNSTNDVNPGNNRRSNADILTLGGEPNFDPAARELSFETDSIEAGQDLELSLQVANLGDDPTGTFKVAFYISSDRLLGLGDTESMFFDIESLEGGESRDYTFAIEVPLNLDQGVEEWYIAARLDPQRSLSGELSTENNVIFSDQTLQVTGATGGCGEDAFEDNDTAARAISLEVGEYLNLGACDGADWFSVDQAANTTLEVRLSASETEEGDTILPRLELSDGNESSFVNAELRNGDLVLVIPPSSRLTRPYIKISSPATALNYNLFISNFAQENESALLLSNLNVSPGIAEAGSAVEVSVLLSNLGQETLAAGQIELDLVNQSNLEAMSLGSLNYEGAENTWSTASLSASASVQIQARFTLPTPLADGLYYVRARHSALNTENHRYAWGLSSLRIDEAQACTSDRFEPNGSPHEANAVSQGAYELAQGSFTGLFACSGDDDWYRIRLDEGDSLDAEITFDRLQGDLDLELYAADGQSLITQSESLQGRESINVFRSTGANEYLLRVFLKSSDQVNLATEYSLNLEIGPSESCGDDGYEPNSSAEEAALLPDGPHDLLVCPGGEDWFRFQIPAGNIISYTISVGFDDVEMSLFDPNDMLVESNNRRIYHEALLTGTYRLRVSPSQQVRPAPYTIVVSGVSGLDLAVDDLRLTSNTGGPGDELYADVQLENRRGDPAQDILVRFVISEDARLSLNDPILGEQEVPFIEGASSINLRQRISIPNNLSPGLYSIICEVDPELTLDDFYLSNNVTRADFELSPACIDDDQRENEGPRTASPLLWAEVPAQFDGVICALTEDWYTITAPAGVRRFTLNAPNGDLDLKIYASSDETLLGSAQSVEPIEQIELNLDQETELYIQVDGFFNASSTYTLAWE